MDPIYQTSAAAAATTTTTTTTSSTPVEGIPATTITSTIPSYTFPLSSLSTTTTTTTTGLTDLGSTSAYLNTNLTYVPGQYTSTYGLFNNTTASTTPGTGSTAENTVTTTSSAAATAPLASSQYVSSLPTYVPYTAGTTTSQLLSTSPTYTSYTPYTSTLPTVTTAPLTASSIINAPLTSFSYNAGLSNSTTTGYSGLNPSVDNYLSYSYTPTTTTTTTTAPLADVSTTTPAATTLPSYQTTYTTSASSYVPLSSSYTPIDYTQYRPSSPAVPATLTTSYTENPLYSSQSYTSSLTGTTTTAAATATVPALSSSSLQVPISSNNYTSLAYSSTPSYLTTTPALSGSQVVTNPLIAAAPTTTISTNSVQLSTPIERSPVRPSYELPASYSSVTINAQSNKDKAEIKAQLNYLKDIKEELLNKHSEFSSEVSGLITSLKNEFDDSVVRNLTSGSEAQINQEAQKKQLEENAEKIRELELALENEKATKAAQASEEIQKYKEQVEELQAALSKQQELASTRKTNAAETRQERDVQSGVNGGEIVFDEEPVEEFTEETFEFNAEGNGDRANGNEKRSHREETDKQGFFDGVDQLRKEVMADPKKALENANGQKSVVSAKVSDLNVQYLGAEKVNPEEKAAREKREKELVEQVASLNAREKELLEQVNKLQSQLTSQTKNSELKLQEKLQSQQKKSDEKSNEGLAKLRSELEEQGKAREAQLENLLRDLESKLAASNTEKDALIQSASSIAAQQSESSKGSQAKVEELKQQISQLSDQLKQSAASNESLAKSHESQLAANAAQHAGDAAKSQIKLDELAAQISNLNAKLQESENKNGQLSNNLAQQVATAKSAAEESSKTLERERSAWESARSALESEKNILAQEKNLLVAQRSSEGSSASNQLKALEDAKESIKNEAAIQVKRLESQLAALRDTHANELNEVQNASQKKLALAESAHADLAKSLSESKSVLADAVKANADVQKQLAEKAKEQDSLSGELADIKKKNAAALKEIENRIVEEKNHLTSQLEGAHLRSLEEVRQKHSAEISKLKSTSDAEKLALKNEMALLEKLAAAGKDHAAIKGVVETLTNEKAALTASLATAAKNSEERENSLKKEIADLKVKIEVQVNAHQKELILAEDKLAQVKKQAASDIAKAQKTAATAAAKSAVVASSSALAPVVEEEIEMSKNNESVISSSRNGGDYAQLHAQYKESERKLLEERKLYAILREERNLLEQQIISLKGNEKKSKDKKAVSPNKQAAGNVAAQVVEGEETANGVEDNAAASTTVTTAKNVNSAVQQKRAKLVSEFEDRHMKEVEMNYLKLKEENAVIRAELREKYEGQIRTLGSAIEFKDNRITALEKAEAELNAIKAEKEELEWSNARKNAEAAAAAAAKSKGNNNKENGVAPSPAEVKKTGLEREKDDLQKVIQKKNEELKTMKKTLNQSQAAFQKLEKTHNALVQKTSQQSEAATAKPVAAAAAAEQNGDDKKQKKAQNKIDADLEAIIRLSNQILQINQD